MKLYCPRCEKRVDRIVWRYVEPVDDYAKWCEESRGYEYEDSTDKGDLDCVTLCYYCGTKLRDFGYDDHEQPTRVGIREDETRRTDE
jgi:hypothetical protein